VCSLPPLLLRINCSASYMCLCPTKQTYKHIIQKLELKRLEEKIKGRIQVLQKKNVYDGVQVGALTSQGHRLSCTLYHLPCHLSGSPQIVVSSFFSLGWCCSYVWHNGNYDPNERDKVSCSRADLFGRVNPVRCAGCIVSCHRGPPFRKKRRRDLLTINKD
jgi:hypothetical protein